MLFLSVPNGTVRAIALLVIVPFTPSIVKAVMSFAFDPAGAGKAIRGISLPSLAFGH